MSNKYLDSIKISERKDKKYKVYVEGKWIHFGDKNYQHYKDWTPLNKYKNKNHLDTERWLRYRKRHQAILLKNSKPAYKDIHQPAYWSYNYLW